MPEKNKNQPSLSTDAFEFIGMMARKRTTKPKPEGKEATEEAEIEKSCYPKTE
ncbi:MAG: hypothetical protein VYB13_04305 [Chloroflexota bacterium]|nr:hypothetical protein [Chloroflexota bacterium]MEC9365629.1 hypothetical protein [Chloroflexota bacterium]MED6296462.1 hypothetical protein [Chloroflexota bacterium]